MATYLVIPDNPAIRQSMLGSQWNALPAGKKVDELQLELGVTVPTQAKAYSSAVVYSNGTEPVFVCNIGQAALNEYLMAVPRSQVKALRMKLANI